MKIVIYLLLALAIYGVVSTHLGVRRSATEAERTVAIRFSAFAWLTGLIFLAAFLFLPNKQRMIMLLPAVLLAIGFAKFWRDKRARLRREDEEKTRLERMKRVN